MSDQLLDDCLRSADVFNNETAVWGRQWNESSLGTLRMATRLPVRVCGTGSRSPLPVTLDVLARWQSGLGEVLDLAKGSLYVLLQVMTNSFVGGPPSRPIWSFAIKFGMCIRLSPLSKTITRSIPSVRIASRIGPLRFTAKVCKVVYESNANTHPMIPELLKLRKVTD